MRHGTQLAPDECLLVIDHDMSAHHEGRGADLRAAIDAAKGGA